MDPLEHSAVLSPPLPHTDPLGNPPLSSEGKRSSFSRVGALTALTARLAALTPSPGSATLLPCFHMGNVKKPQQEQDGPPRNRLHTASLSHRVLKITTI